MIPVFVYGTLLVGEANHQLIASQVLSVCPGAVYGKLYDCGAYPALVLGGYDSGDPVAGEWLSVTPDALARMDELEEYYGPGMRNDYERVWVRDARQEEREGWVYVWGDSRGCPVIPGNSWRRHLHGKKA